MIKISMKRFNKVVELKLPTEHEHVMLGLWRLGLQRDPAKYTLRELNAVISYDTAWEHQMTSLVSIKDTLQDTLMLLQHMMAPPEPIAAGLRAGVVAGVYKTGKAFLTDLEMQVDKNAVYEATMYFPLSGEIVDAKGNVMAAPAQMLIAYEQMIASALFRVQMQTLHSETYLFSEVPGLYKKLLSVYWGTELIDDRLCGKVVFLLTGKLTDEEAEDTAEKIEMIHGMEFSIRLKQWSVLTGQGLLCIYMCDESGDYGIIPQDDEDEYEEEAVCLCPECQARLFGNQGVVLDPEELEEDDE